MRGTWAVGYSGKPQNSPRFPEGAPGRGRILQPLRARMAQPKPTDGSAVSGGDGDARLSLWDHLWLCCRGFTWNRGT